MIGTQRVVYDIICASRILGYQYITSQRIKDEIVMTIRDEKLFDKYPYDIKQGLNKTVLDRRVEQSLYHLKKRNMIRQVKRGRWVPTPPKYVLPEVEERVSNGYLVKIYNYIPKVDCIVINGDE